MKTKSIFVVIPAYNESTKIAIIVKELKERGYNNIVIVDDGSKDNTFNTISSIKGIHTLQHIINRGQGAALQTGTDFSIFKGADYIVHFDSDGQHNASEIELFLKKLNEGYDIVLGSRFINTQDNTSMPLKKRVTLKLGIIFTWLISGIWLTDTHNGFRAMTSETAKKLKIKLDRFEHASEILDKIYTLNLKYAEVPVTIEYSEYSLAKGQPISNSIKIAVSMVWYKLNRILFKEKL